MQVLKMLEKGTKFSSDYYQYRNALKTYFNRDNISITQVQADTACEYLLTIYDSYSPDDPQFEKKFFDEFIYVLAYLGVRVIYDRANSTADFIGTDGSLVMSKLQLKALENGGRTVVVNPIKNTGTSAQSAFWIAAAGAGFALAGVSLLILWKRKEEPNGD